MVGGPELKMLVSGLLEMGDPKLLLKLEGKLELGGGGTKLELGPLEMTGLET